MSARRQIIAALDASDWRCCGWTDTTDTHNTSTGEPT